MKWEYTYRQFNAFNDKERQTMMDVLEGLGRAGWELIALYNGNCFVFKRPVEEKQASVE